MRSNQEKAYLIFVTSTTSGAGVKIFRPVSKKCELVCFSVKIMNFVSFGVKKSGIGVFLVSVENGAGVKKMTNFEYAIDMRYRSKLITRPNILRTWNVERTHKSTKIEVTDEQERDADLVRVHFRVIFEVKWRRIVHEMLAIAKS